MTHPSAAEEFVAQPISERRATAGALPLIRLEHLWALLAVCTMAAFISMQPTAPNDFWWHLKAGQLIATSGIPTTNMFAWTLPADAPFVYQSWLGEYLFYLLYRLGGLPLAIFARNALGTAAFAMVAWEGQQRTGSWRWGAAAAALAAAMTINNLTTRTQNWSWVPFMLTLFLLSRFAEGRLRARWLVVLPLIMVFWVNAHGAFVMGLLVAGAFVAGETLRRLLRMPRALAWERLRLLYASAAAMFAATVVNPLGVGVFGYVVSLLGDSSSQTFISEWQAPDPRTLAGAFFFFGVLVLIGSFAFQRRRPTISDLLIVCGLAWQAFIGVRYVVWFGMAAMPIAMQALSGGRPLFSLNNERPQPSGREHGPGRAANLATALLLVLMVATLQPWTKWRLPFPDYYQSQFTDLPGAPQLFAAATPVGAVEHLRSTACAGPIFNEMGYGSYMAWALYPQAQSFIDPRVELFPISLWEDYIAITNGRDLPAYFERYGVACVLLDKEEQPRLAAAMATLAGWERSFADEQSEVWRRR